MTTYIIQNQNVVGEWVNYTDSNGFPIEFLSMDAAQTVANDLSCGCRDQWQTKRIVDSQEQLR